MREVGDLLEAHVRHEERVLFPLLERLLGDAGLAELGLGRGEGEAVDDPRGNGPLWGAASEDLNATLLAWSPGSGPPEHVNDERDVLLVVVDGAATVAVDGEEQRLERGETLIVSKGRSRKITAGPQGVRYVSAHVRRPPLQIGSRAPSAAPGERPAAGP